MLLYGASGHAKVIIDILFSLNISIRAIFDDDPDKTELFGLPVVGAYKKDYEPSQEMVISIGDNHLRKKIVPKIQHGFATVISDFAIISNFATLEEGCVVFQGAVIQNGTEIGKHVIINTSASIDHDNSIGDYCHVAPNATLCGGITVGEGTLIGAGSVVNPNLTIGKWSVIGAGSVVINNIPDHCVAAGNPARIIRKLLL